MDRGGLRLPGDPLARRTAALPESGIVSAVSLWLIASASVFTWLLAREQVPQLVASALLTLSSQPWFFLLASLVLFTGLCGPPGGPPLPSSSWGRSSYPLAAQMGVSALHFSILIVACVGIGLFLPPVGVGLLIACSMARATVPSVMGTVGLYLGVLLVGLLLVAFVPWITLVLPRWLLGQS